MALSLVVDALDSVPEALRTEYTEKDGKFHLNVADLPDVTGLKNTVNATRAERDALKNQIQQWAKLGKAPDEIESMLTAERQKAEEALIKAGKVDEVIAKKLGEAKLERDNAVSAAEKQRETALGIARKAIVGNNVANALVKGKASEEGMSILPRILGDRIKIDFADDGSETVSILEADGRTPMVGSGKGGLATFDDLVKEAVKQYPSLFEGTSNGGSGMDQKGQRREAGSKTITRSDFEALGPIERSKKIKDGFKLVDS